MRILNLNPKPDIGASAWLVELDGCRLLMDAGTHPKHEGLESLPLYDRIEGDHLDAIAVSHCHHDHVGSLPLAIRRFPESHVLMTQLSYFIVERVLHNSVNVMARQREELGIREYPLYSHDEVDEMAPLFQGFRYNRQIEWASPERARAGTSPTLEFYDAGHALGSAGIMVRGTKGTLFYTGDVCFSDQTILKGARFEGVRADVLIMETTRGNRQTPVGFSRQAEVDRFTASLQAVLERKGSVLIPTFALGRTQEILALLALLMKAGKIKKQAVYIGGLGRVFTEIYDLEAHRTHRQHSALQLHEALQLSVLDRRQIERLKLGGGKIFVLTAGMMSENTGAHDIAMRLASDANNAVFFVGYTDPSTPGGRFRMSKPGQPFTFSGGGGELTRECQMESFDLTAHANREDLLEFVGQVSPRTVVLGHGEADSRQWFEENIRANYPRIQIFQPGPGEEILAG
jgi:Cft2 family RNA processing exonuclease